MLEIQNDEVHLWALSNDELLSDSLIDRYRRNVLSDDECQKEESLHTVEARRQYVVTRALVRTTLSRYTSHRPVELVFDVSENGKPSLSPKHNLPEPIYYNVSHTSGAIVLAVAKNRMIGVDIEKLKERGITGSGFLDRFFHADEARAIHSTVPRLRAAQFYQYWTLKESYVKAVGSTLPAAMKQVHFHFDGQCIEAFFSEKHSVVPAWQFWIFQPSDDHILSVCTQGIEGRQTEFVIREVTPLEGDKHRQWKMLCTSY